MTTCYAPQPGTIPARVIALMADWPSDQRIASPVLAVQLEVDISSMLSSLEPAIRHGAVVREKKAGRVFFGRGTGEPPAQDEPDDDPPRQRVVSTLSQQNPQSQPRPIELGWVPAPPVDAPAEPSEPAAAASATLRVALWSDGELVIENPKPYIVRIGQTGHGDASKARSIDQPLTTVTTKAEHLLVAPALVANFLAKHYGDRGQRPGSLMDEPVSTITASDHHSLVASHLVKLRGTSNSAAANEPLATISAGGWHHAEVRALLLAYYGTDQAGQLGDPLATVTTRDRFGLVTVKGQDYVIADIGMRMLQPRELFRAQGFPDSYVIEYGIDPTTRQRIPLNKGDQVRMCGNSVCPNVARAVVAANYSDFEQLREAA